MVQRTQHRHGGQSAHGAERSVGHQLGEIAQHGDVLGNLAAGDDAVHHLDAARRADKALAEESLGTGHGAREASYASYTTFERDSARPDEVVSIWYDSLAKLQARGVVPRPRPLPPSEPQAFPAGFVADPPQD